MVTKIKIDESIKKWNAKNPEKRQMTRTLLAEKANCSYALLNNLQAGKVGKGTQILNRIGGVLDCTIDDLIER